MIVAIAATTTCRLGRTAVRNRRGLALLLPSLLAVALGVNEVLVLALKGLAGIALCGPHSSWPARLAAGLMPVAAAGGFQSAQVGDRTLQLGLFFLRVGSLIPGSGVVLYAFIQRDVVAGYGWLTQQQLLDAIAVGQTTPGPVLSSATFIGYLVSGVQAAIAATVGVFAPSFVIISLIGPWTPRLRRAPVAQAFLRGVNAAVLSLMLAVAFVLFRSAIIDPLTAIVAGVEFASVLRFRTKDIWLVAGGALLVLATYLATGR